MGQRDASLYESIGEALRQSGQFEDVSVRVFGHRAVYWTGQWIDLATTHSDHHALAPEQPESLLTDVRERIDEAGASFPCATRRRW